MDRSVASQIADLTMRASRLLDESAAFVRGSAPEKAAGVYRSAVGRAMGEMAAGILFRVWREHPELEPPYMKDTEGAYDPRAFQLPPEVAAHAIKALDNVADIMSQVETLLSKEPDHAEREAFAAELAGVRREILDAKRGVERRTGPMESGRPTIG